MNRTTKYANLHLHSIYSDGIATPEELCQIVKEMGYRALALTDHETIAGCARLKKAADEAGLETLIGVEISATLPDGRETHLTGYDFDPAHSRIHAYLARREDEAERMTRLWLAACQKAGLFREITWNDVLSAAPEHACLCNEHIFAALMRKAGYTQKDYWAFRSDLFSARPADLPVSVPLSTQETIDMIREAGGVTLIAHPHELTDSLPLLWSQGLRGAEYDHPDIDDCDSRQVMQFARTHDFYLSGGTDHTGRPGNSMERGDWPLVDGKRADTSLLPYDADVVCGSTQEEFQNLKHRVFG